MINNYDRYTISNVYLHIISIKIIGSTTSSKYYKMSIWTHENDKSIK